MNSIAQRWFGEFMETVKTHEASTTLREAAERHLAVEVVQSMEIPTRSGLGGETLVVVGSRNETATFPYGFFKDWTLDANTARFRRH